MDWAGWFGMKDSDDQPSYAVLGDERLLAVRPYRWHSVLALRRNGIENEVVWARIINPYIAYSFMSFYPFFHSSCCVWSARLCWA